MLGHQRPALNSPFDPPNFGQGAPPVPPPFGAREAAPFEATLPSIADPVLQRIWVRAQASAWTTLALVGWSAKSPEATMAVARGLARVASDSGGGLSLMDGRSLELRHMPQVQARLRASVSRQTAVVLPLPRVNPASVSVAQACDAAVLVVFLGETSQVVARQTIEQIGRDRFFGTIIVRPRR